MDKHANDWAPEAPTPAQLKEFFAQIQSGRVTKSRLQDFLRDNLNVVVATFKHDKTENGWKLLEDVPFDGKQFILEIVEFLRPGESSVNGKEMKQRAKRLNAHLGQHHAEYLLDHQGLIPKEWRGKYCLAFPGTVWLLGVGGGRCDIPFLGWNGKEWCLSFGSLEGDWNVLGRLVTFRE